MVVSVPVPLKVWAVQSSCPNSRYCTSQPVIAGMPVVSGIAQLTSRAVVGFAVLAETVTLFGASGGSLALDTFTESVSGAESSVPSRAVTLTS